MAANALSWMGAHEARCFVKDVLHDFQTVIGSVDDLKHHVVLRMAGRYGTAPDRVLSLLWEAAETVYAEHVEQQQNAGRAA